MRMVFFCLVFFAVWARAYSTELGAHAGIYIPAAEYIAETYCSSPAVGVNILIHKPEYSFEGSLTIVFPQHDTEVENFSASMIPLLAGIRYTAGPIFYGAGGALHFVTEKYNDPVLGEYSKSSGLKGVYCNLGTFVHPGGLDIELSAKYHIIDFVFDKAWVSVTTGIAF